MTQADEIEAPAPYRIWPESMPFRRNGTPVVGNMGSSVRRVVIMDAETFKRLVSETPALATARFEVADG